jgi:endonuclease IV
MALLKQIELDSGIILNYHRLVAITKVTNHSTVLEVAGYTSQEKRKQEVEQLKNMDEVTVYIDTTFVSADYNEEATIKDWYAYLKTIDKYAGAEDDEWPAVVDPKENDTSNNEIETEYNTDE